MHDFIRRLARWLALLLVPAPPRPGPYPSDPAGPVPQTRPEPLPRLRSPYGREPYTVDAGAVPLVRPYLVAYERECAMQRRRRLALVLAADFGIDLDRHVVGTSGVAF
ncbi:hypothetical protein ABGT92_28680 [Streptomyces cinereoruber]|uniref:hypothetical protein n=1 Tax=Streptomyces cinereoruber TaxID=67260 RepID=UPI00345D6DE0